MELFNRLLLTLVLIGLSVVSSSGQELRRSQPTQGVVFTHGFEVTYDDNPYEYSPEDREEFMNNTRPYRYPIESLDDFITSLSLSARLGKWLIPQNTLNLHYEQHHYGANSSKSYQVFSVDARQRLLDLSYLQLGYSFLPSYLIRDYLDEDIPLEDTVPVYAGCDFRQHLLSFELEGEVRGGVSLSAFYEMEIDNYNENFNEYDTKANIFGAKAGYKLKEIFSLDLGYRFKQARAKGYDEEGESKETSNDWDPSYNEDTFVVGAGFHLERTWGVPVSFNLGYSFGRERFTTEKSVDDDPHSGREDWENNLSVGLEYKPNPRLSWSLSYSYNRGDVYSEYSGEIEEVGDFSQNRLSAGLRLSY